MTNGSLDLPVGPRSIGTGVFSQPCYQNPQRTSQSVDYPFQEIPDLIPMGYTRSDRLREIDPSGFRKPRTPRPEVLDCRWILTLAAHKSSNLAQLAKVLII
jgi:hypothetical protein